MDTTSGKVLAVFLMVVGASTILYTLTLVGRNIIEGNVRDYFSMSEKEEFEKIKNH